MLVRALRVVGWRRACITGLLKKSKMDGDTVPRRISTSGQHELKEDRHNGDTG
jgi:hypothetical protein